MLLIAPDSLQEVSRNIFCLPPGLLWSFRYMPPLLVMYVWGEERAKRSKKEGIGSGVLFCHQIHPLLPPPHYPPWNTPNMPTLFSSPPTLTHQPPTLTHFSPLDGRSRFRSAHVATCICTHWGCQWHCFEESARIQALPELDPASSTSDTCISPVDPKQIGLDCRAPLCRQYPQINDLLTLVQSFKAAKNYVWEIE